MPLSIFSDIVPTFIVIIYDLFDLNVEFAWMREDLLGKYRTCDHQVSKQAWNCPHYGQPSPTKEIKDY